MGLSRLFARVARPYDRARAAVVARDCEPRLAGHGAKSPEQAHAIVAANHISEADPLALCYYLWTSGHYPVFLAGKQALFGHGFVARVVRAADRFLLTATAVPRRP